MDDLIFELLDELKSYIKSERSIDGFPNDTALEDGQNVEFVSSTFANDRMIHIWEVGSSGEQTHFIGSEHSDGGVTVFCDGPWKSLEDAQNSYGDCPEGWS